MLTVEERAGHDIFRGKGQCLACHGGLNLTTIAFTTPVSVCDSGRSS